MRPTWKKYLLYGGAIIIGAIVIAMLIETIHSKRTGFETKTLWDWMALLVIPAFLAGGAYFLNRSEKERERENADKRIKEDRQIAENRIKEDRQLAEDRAKLEREIATDRQQEFALQSYLDRMTELLLKENLRTSENEEVRNVARIRTLTVLRGLDPTRKGLIVRFLHEAGLIDVNKTVIELHGADLSGADLGVAYLGDAALREANLRDANLNWANLENADLSGANLENAELLDTNLENANLENAELLDANLENANLIGANFTDANLDNVRSLSGATMPDGTKHD